MHSLDDFRKTYHKAQVPDSLDYRLSQALTGKRRHNMTRTLRTAGLSLAAGLIVFVGSLNALPSFAEALVDLPIIGSFVEVVSLNLEVQAHEAQDISIQTPQVTGLEDQDVQATINQAYVDEAMARYQAYMEEMGDLLEEGAHSAFNSGYIVETDTDDILSIGQYFVEVAGSSSNEVTYTTLDKVNGLVITLPSLFKDDTYLAIISDYLKATMEDLMAKDDSYSYFIGDPGFTGITEDQDFYISSDHKLVIAFDKYEVSPGYMGVQTFEIPSHLLQDILVSQQYIQ